MSGGCHCGRVRFRVTADLSRVTECNCSICTKKGFLHLIVAPEQFELGAQAGLLSADQLPDGGRIAEPGRKRVELGAGQHVRRAGRARRYPFGN